MNEIVQALVLFWVILIALCLVGLVLRATKHKSSGWTHTLSGSTWQQDPEKIKKFREYRRGLENEGKVFRYTDGMQDMGSRLTRDEKITALKKSRK